VVSVLIWRISSEIYVHPRDRVRRADPLPGTSESLRPDPRVAGSVATRKFAARALPRTVRVVPATPASHAEPVNQSRERPIARESLLCGPPASQPRPARHQGVDSDVAGLLTQQVFPVVLSVYCKLSCKGYVSEGRHMDEDTGERL
jgi:hypothetical protein